MDFKNAKAKAKAKWTLNFDKENPIEDFYLFTNVHTLDFVIGDLRKILKHKPKSM